MTIEIENKIKDLMAEAYKIIREQEKLINQNNVLQDKKMRIAQEINSLEAKLALEIPLETKEAATK